MSKTTSSSSAIAGSPLILAGERLYVALQSGDVPALDGLLSPDFSGDVTRGLPKGMGLVYEGRDAMMAAWGEVATFFDMAPNVERMWDCGDMLIARGGYVGRARASGRGIDAKFAHFWTFDGTRFTSLQQITDSGAWRDALLDE